MRIPEVATTLEDDINNLKSMALVKAELFSEELNSIQKKYSREALSEYKEVIKQILIARLDDRNKLIGLWIRCPSKAERMNHFFKLSSGNRMFLIRAEIEILCSFNHFFQQDLHSDIDFSRVFNNLFVYFLLDQSLEADDSKENKEAIIKLLGIFKPAFLEGAFNFIPPTPAQITCLFSALTKCKNHEQKIDYLRVLCKLNYQHYQQGFHIEPKVITECLLSIAEGEEFASIQQNERTRKVLSRGLKRLLTGDFIPRFAYENGLKILENPKKHFDAAIHELVRSSELSRSYIGMANLFKSPVQSHVQSPVFHSQSSEMVVLASPVRS